MARVDLPAGWYPDPDEGGENWERYFDGTDWAEQTRDGPSVYEQRMLDIAERNYRGAHRVRVLLWMIVAVIVGVPLLIFVVALIFASIHG